MSEDDIPLEPWRFVPAPSDGIGKYSKQVSALIKLLSKYMGWDDEGEHVYVSDLSTLGDFCLEDEELVQLSQEVGFNVHHEDYIKDIAMRMSDGW